MLAFASQKIGLLEICANEGVPADAMIIYAGAFHLVTIRVLEGPRFSEIDQAAGGVTMTLRVIGR